MNYLGILTCANWPQLIESDRNLISLFSEVGIQAEAVIWDDGNVHWQKFDALIFRNTWDYFHKPQQFYNWLHYIKSIGIPTINSVDTVLWNLDKIYLKELADKGINIIPTYFIKTVNKALDLNFIVDLNWTEFIIKPSVSAGSFYTEKHTISDHVTVAEKYGELFPNHLLLVQRFEPAILSQGETSLIFNEFSFSHSVRKLPRKGDFRIQSQFGGSYEAYSPKQNIIDYAYHTLKTMNREFTYARVDGIEVDNQFYIMEIELIEPDLYHQFFIKQQATFVSCIAHKISNL